MAHKTFDGMAKAVERLIGQLEASPPADGREHAALHRKHDALARELGALWSNPADASHAARLRYRLSEAWYKATS
jgi:hypothetical protein